MEERSVTLYDILDDKVADGYTEEQCDKHAVSELTSRRIECHKNERRKDPDKAEITGRSDGNHQMIHER